MECLYTIYILSRNFPKHILKFSAPILCYISMLYTLWIILLFYYKLVRWTRVINHEIPSKDITIA